ncbi:hypothetical protein H6P81_007777 [Aristolochia fimbriata]|uniref:protein-tyrosine-phosphatase n=1 Tax=Aristolochia fimbriata TaxID=158543 RepID=A0AAV7F1H9_ARIFI|nr:hypothetical protein H6P81_007777 [Aristolochia fimbriata]
MSLVEPPILVRERLFIGNINHAAKVLQEGDDEITHILSLLSSASISFFSEWRANVSIKTKEIRKVYAGDDAHSSSNDQVHSENSAVGNEKLLYLLEHAGPELKQVRMAVPLRDMENENLLDYLDVCLNFIEKSREEGSVLVHCFAGVSRSAAVITAYLMRTEQLSLEDALESLRLRCESVCPNDGFLEQLKMFEDMGFRIDHASPIYKRFRLKQMGESYNRGDKIDVSKFGIDPGTTTENFPSETAANSTRSTKLYRCKRCRRIVALQDHVISHTPGEGEACFEWKKWRSGNPFNCSDEGECSSIFIEPLKWMTEVEEGALEGKLSCANCDARLGNFNWSGIQCSCGSWITPAFQIHKSRVDLSAL